MRTTTSFLAACLAVASVTSAQTAAPAQTPAAAPAPPPAQTPAPAQAEAPVAPALVSEPGPENYTYAHDGRRDPFLNLLGTGGTPQTSGRRDRRSCGTDGCRDYGAWRARQRRRPDRDDSGARQQTYIVRQGDKLVDGTIRTVTRTGLVIDQEVNDPLSLVKQREIHKLLRSQEGAKE